MLNENIKAIRKEKGLSQEELATKCHVVRQTISKWESGLSVPDADLLISISNALETPVSTLLGESVSEKKEDSIEDLSKKLEGINLQLAQRNNTKKKWIQGICIGVCVLIIVIFVILYFSGSSYLGWDTSNPETAVLGVGFHALEWGFVRVAPIVFIVAVIVLIRTRKA